MTGGTGFLETYSWLAEFFLEIIANIGFLNVTLIVTLMSPIVHLDSFQRLNQIAKFSL